MWKDFFYFSKRERKGILYLSLISIVVLGVRIFLIFNPFFINGGSDNCVDKEYEKWLMYVNDSIRIKESKAFSDSLFQFDPNTVSAEELVKLGFSSVQIRNLKKYIERGGVFCAKSDLAKIYGVDHEFYNKLKPYVRFQSIKKVQKSIKKSERQENSVRVNNIRTRAKLCFNINSVDVFQLDSLKGIGPVLAERIVKYRDLIGGYYSIDQLGNVYGISNELVETLKEFLFVDSKLIHKIDVNKVTVRKLKSHPLFSFYMAKELVEYRQSNGAYSSIDSLFLLKSFNGIDSAIVFSYLCVNE